MDKLARILDSNQQSPVNNSNTAATPVAIQRGNPSLSRSVAARPNDAGMNLAQRGLYKELHDI